MRISSLAMPFAAALLGAVPTVAAAQDDVLWLGRFGDGTSGWTTTQIDKKVPATRYRAVRTGGHAAVEAVADRSMALFLRRTNVVLADYPILCWRWRVASVVQQADIRTKKGDDMAARVYVGLDLPSKSLSLGARARLSLGRSRYGELLPDGALNYVWDNKVPVGTILPNAFTDRARMIVMRSGNAQAGQWVTERRDLLADMQSQFKTAAGRMTLLAIASDTDNTGARAEAAFADLHLVKRGAPCRW